MEEWERQRLNRLQYVVDQIGTAVALAIGLALGWIAYNGLTANFSLPHWLNSMLAVIGGLLVYIGAKKELDVEV